MSQAVDVAGWAGAALLILAYTLVSWEQIAARSHLYQSLNIAGSALILLNSLYYQALPSAATNLFWILVGVSVTARGKRAGGSSPHRM